MTVGGVISFKLEGEKGGEKGPMNKKSTNLYEIDALL